MDEQRYWSVRDACWLPSPRPLSLLETPWSLHARPCPQPRPCPTPAQDLRWLPLPPARARDQRLPAQRTGGLEDSRAGTAVAGGGTAGSAATSARRPVSGAASRRT